MSTDVKGWTPEQERFLLWLALPKAARRPRTQRALAVELDVAEETLSRWKDMPGFRLAVAQRARELVLDDIPDVLQVVRTQAKAGELPFVQMVLAMAGMRADAETPNSSTVVKVYAGFDPTDV